MRFNRTFIKSIAEIKRCAAETNLELGALEKNIADEIIKAAELVSKGDYDSEFVVDIFQTGSGTSTNMNTNEVISNVAIKNMGA